MGADNTNMEKIKNYLKECNCNNLIFNQTAKNAMAIEAKDDNFGLTAVCNPKTIKAALVAKNGRTLYKIDSTNLDEDSVIAKLDEIINLYKNLLSTNCSVTQDLNNENDAEQIDASVTNVVVESDQSSENKDDEKTLLLDNETESEDVNITIETESYKSLDDLKNDLSFIAQKSESLISLFSDDDAKNRSIVVGLISSIYEVIEELNDFKHDLDEEAEKAAEEAEEIEESLAVAPKISYIDLACRGLSQACNALSNDESKKAVVKILKDINSELQTSN